VRFALAAALVTFARSLDAEICAEGIEKDAELAALQHLGIAYGQGYFLGRPLPLPLASPPKGIWGPEPAPEGPTARVRLRSGRAVARWSARPEGGVVTTLSMPPVPARPEPRRTIDAGRPDAGVAIADEAFDRVTRWAVRLLGAPISAFALVAPSGHGLASASGLAESFQRTGLASFLQPLFEAVAASRQVVAVADVTVPNALGPSAGHCLAFVGGFACAGVAVRGASGEVFGTLSVIDVIPREWTPEEERLLQELADALATELELRAFRQTTRDAPRPTLPSGQ
jgi:hypothetical protein